MRFAPEGWIFVVPWLGLAVGFWIADYPAWALALLAVAIATALFFRDPHRASDAPREVLVAPADGKILRVDEVEADFNPGGRALRIATFLSVFDVHVQRCPTSGEVIDTIYRPGAKVAAFRDDADRVNEQRLTLLRSESGEMIAIVQIAGLLARRVVGYLEPGDRVERSSHLGLIKFGSRVDLLVPPGYIIDVQPGDRVWAGRTGVARPPDERNVD